MLNVKAVFNSLQRQATMRWTIKTINKNSRILVVRNDKLGDFMLSWPSFAILKQYWPEATICALVPQYTADMAHLCPWIDEVVIDEGENIWKLRRKLACGRFDVMLVLFSTLRIALSSLLAKIPYRLAPATKLYQFLYQNRLVQRRSHSAKPEYAYNLDLAYRLLHELHGDELIITTQLEPEDYLPTSLARPLLIFDEIDVATLRNKFFSQYGIESDARLIFIHPGNGGSANNLTPEQYINLAERLKSLKPLTIVITAGPGEEEVASGIANNITKHSAVFLPPKKNLIELAKHLQFADLFISCSTGPLHIAGALDLVTAAFYPRHRSGSPLRWQTLNAPMNRLVFTPEKGADETHVASIDVSHAAAKISERFLLKQ